MIDLDRRGAWGLLRLESGHVGFLLPLGDEERRTQFEKFGLPILEIEQGRHETVTKLAVALVDIRKREFDRQGDTVTPGMDKTQGFTFRENSPGLMTIGGFVAGVVTGLERAKRDYPDSGLEKATAWDMALAAYYAVADANIAYIEVNKDQIDSVSVDMVKSKLGMVGRWLVGLVGLGDLALVNKVLTTRAEVYGWMAADVDRDFARFVVESKKVGEKMIAPGKQVFGLLEASFVDPDGWGEGLKPVGRKRDVADKPFLRAMVYNLVSSWDNMSVSERGDSRRVKRVEEMLVKGTEMLTQSDDNKLVDFLKGQGAV